MCWECRATSVRKLTAYLMIYGQHIRRLDVNGSHRNRTGGREEWVERTDKHWFSEAHQDAVAYIPDDIPSLHQASRHAATWTRHRTSCGCKGPYPERLA